MHSKNGNFGYSIFIPVTIKMMSMTYELCLLLNIILIQKSHMSNLFLEKEIHKLKKYAVVSIFGYNFQNSQI